MPVIKPSVGRVVLYYPHGKTDKETGSQPYAASVAYVHSDRLINIGYINHNGEHGHETSVALLQPGDPTPDVGRFCEWMPYQIGQAAKSEELQAKLNGK
jgi:hypothetical protein